MHPVAYVFFLFGVALVITGIVLFIKMGTQGTSSVKMLGFEFQLGGSALVIFVVGVIIFIFPIVFRSEFPVDTSYTPPTQHFSTPTVSTAASPADTPQGVARYMVRTSYGTLRFDMNRFATIEECDRYRTRLADSPNYVCDIVPDAAYCISYFEQAGVQPLIWECYGDNEACREALQLHDLEAQAGGKREVRTRCARMSIHDVLAKF
jgi:hypothetical protein